MEPELIQKGRSMYIHFGGFLYVKSDSGKGDVVYWKCRKNPTCSARLVTLKTGRTDYTVRKGGSANTHTGHGPDPEEVQALRLMGNIKRSAITHPERPPSAVMREVQSVQPGVQARLPELPNIRKTIQRERLKELPTNPTDIKDLEG